MMLATEGLRVGLLATTHIPLVDVAKSITPRTVLAEVIRNR